MNPEKPRDNTTADGSSEELLQSLYTELRQLAKFRLSKEIPGQTLTATALVHEVWLRLSSSQEPGAWTSKAHFFGAAAEAMRRVLIDNARRKASVRHGGEHSRVDFEIAEAEVAMSREKAQALLELHESLKVFEQTHPIEAQLVELRFFAGLTMEEAAEVLDIARRTAQRYWAFAKASLSQLMNQNDEPA